MKENKKYIRGIITPALWDENGRPTGVSISTFDEKVFLIDNDEKGKELLSFIREEVEIKGIFFVREGVNRIRVKGFSRLKEPGLIEK
jgi:hypothetical protein